MNNSTPGYAESMAEIKSILIQLDADDVDIDNLSELVGRAAQLIENCRCRLTTAEASVNQIVAHLESDSSDDTESDDTDDTESDDANPAY